MIGKRKYMAMALLMAASAMLTGFAYDDCGKKQDDIFILYTNDVHCGIDENIGYAGLAAYDDIIKEKTE